MSEPTSYLLPAAYLLLLSKFRKGDSPAGYRGVSHWEAALQEKPETVIKQLFDEGILERGELPDLVNYKFRATDLKLMLKERGLKVSGRKAELVQRLIDNSLKAMMACS